MRGAQPDAECPRCGHRQPPSGAIVACPKCNLAFPPKELQHRSRPATSEALVVAKPAALVLANDGDQLAYCWSDHSLNGLIAIGTSSVLGLLVWSSMVSLFDKVAYSVFLVMLSFYGLSLARKRARVHVDRNQIHSVSGTLLLADISRIDVEGGDVTALDRYGKFHMIVSTTHHEIAAYIAEDLSHKLATS